MGFWVDVAGKVREDGEYLTHAGYFDTAEGAEKEAFKVRDALYKRLSKEFACAKAGFAQDSPAKSPKSSLKRRLKGLETALEALRRMGKKADDALAEVVEGLSGQVAASNQARVSHGARVTEMEKVLGSFQGSIKLLAERLDAAELKAHETARSVSDMRGVERGELLQRVRSVEANTGVLMAERADTMPGGALAGRVSALEAVVLSHPNPSARIAAIEALLNEVAASMGLAPLG